MQVALSIQCELCSCSRLLVGRCNLGGCSNLARRKRGGCSVRSSNFRSQPGKEWRKRINVHVGSFDRTMNHRGSRSKSSSSSALIQKPSKNVLAKRESIPQFPHFRKVWEGELVTPATRKITFPGAGNYIARIRPPPTSHAASERRNDHRGTRRTWGGCGE